jgi:hypothetical protein
MTAFTSFFKKLLTSCSSPCGSYDLKNLIISFGMICYNEDILALYQYFQKSPELRRFFNEKAPRSNKFGY